MFMKKIINGYDNVPFSIITGAYPNQIIDSFLKENRKSSDLSPLVLENLAKHTSDDGVYQSDLEIHQRQFNGKKKLRQIDPLLKAYFLKQLRCEKRRADRTKAPLSIVLFRFDADKSPELGKLLELLQSSTRETDSVGYLEDDLIGLLLPDTDQKGTQECINKVAKEYDNPFFSVIAATYPDQIFDKLSSESEEPLDHYPLFFEESSEPKRFGLSIKRILDILGSLAGILLLSPLMLITALAIKIDSPGPVIFKQTRLGQRGIPFAFYKFRSMFTDTDDRIHRDYITRLIKGHLEEVNQGDKETPLYKIKSDPRVTRIGRIIRKTSVDELPQLINVLKGEMSLVGPRPPLPYEVEKYQSWHLRRVLEARPGITGLWQVGGRSQTTFDDMVRLDLRYIRHWSLLLDLKILLKTVKVVFKSTSAF